MATDIPNAKYGVAAIVRIQDVTSTVEIAHVMKATMVGGVLMSVQRIVHRVVQSPVGSADIATAMSMMVNVTASVPQNVPLVSDFFRVNICTRPTINIFSIYWY